MLREWWRLVAFVAFVGATIALIPPSRSFGRHCDDDDEDDDCYREHDEEKAGREKLKPPQKGPAVPTNLYRAFLADRSAATALRFDRVPVDLWPPFTWEVTAGLLHPDRRDTIGQGLFGTELDAEGTEPLEFYGLFAQFLNGGMNAFVSTHDGNQGQQFFPGVTALDLRVTADAMDMHFFVRPRGQGAYQQIATVPYTAPTTALQPAVGMFNVGGGTEVGFDNERLVLNSPPPTAPSALEAAQARVFDAWSEQLAASQVLDGATPDLAAGVAAVDRAVTALDGAIGAVGALPSKRGKASSPRESALRLLGKARKQLGSVAKGLAKPSATKEKPRLKAILQLAKAGEFEVEAVKTLDGDDL